MVKSSDNMITGNLDKNIVVQNGNLALELDDNDTRNCKTVVNLLVCENVGAVFQKQ